jgi:hypothetical protein
MDEGTNVGTRPGEAERPQESGAASPGRGGRMSRQRKTAAVLRLLRGEDLELVSRSLGVTAADPRLPSQKRAPRGRRRRDPLEPYWDSRSCRCCGQHRGCGRSPCCLRCG